MPTPEQIDPRWKKKPLSEKEAKEIMKDPYVEYKGGFLGMPKNQKDYSKEINDLTERIESLERFIKNIFDGHVLIDGRFVNINPKSTL